MTRAPVPPEAPAVLAQTLRASDVDFVVRAGRNVSSRHMRWIILAGSAGALAAAGLVAWSGAVAGPLAWGIVGVIIVTDAVALAFVSSFAGRPGPWFAGTPMGLVEARGDQVCVYPWSQFHESVKEHRAGGGDDVTLRTRVPVSRPGPFGGRQSTEAGGSSWITMADVPDAMSVASACRARISEARLAVAR